MLAHLLSDSLLDALEEMVKEEPSGTESLSEKHDRVEAQLQKLNEEEGADYERIFSSDIPVGIQQIMNHAWDPFTYRTASLVLLHRLQCIANDICPHFHLVIR